MPLPVLIHDQDQLLTLNSNDQPVFHDAIMPGVDVQPLFLDPANGVWVLRVIFHPGVVLPTHYHTGTVHLWTQSGSWHYLEYPDQPQTKGSYLFEPGGSVHTFNVPAENTEPTETLMVVSGTNVNFDADGNFLGMLDANSIMLALDGLVRERGLDPARYITPPQSAYSAGA
ncbi:MAG: 2,4'-dihydroxyacetophenone dioxygenase [Deltaproteobacteria bacterium]|nr:2,4'-dihydroxyacetophenone dioxygenase [Deltaproteobacteria bacterium]